jgi:phospholipid transport system substrate-binding protein
MIKTLFPVFLALLSVSSVSSVGYTAPEASNATALDEAGAKNLIDALGKSVLSIFKEGGNREEKKRKFAELFEKYFNVSFIAKAMIKQYWKTASDQEKKEYVSLFKKDIVNIYFNLLETHYRPDDDWKVDKAEASKSDPKAFAVLSRVVRGNGQNLMVKWHVSNGKIIDAIVEKISTSHSKRTEYKALWRESGGNFPGFLNTLRQKVDRMSSEGPKQP